MPKGEKELWSAFGVLDLGGAHGLLMEIIRFRLPLGFRLPLLFICVLHELVFGFEPWFVMCDELC